MAGVGGWRLELECFALPTPKQVPAKYMILV